MLKYTSARSRSAASGTRSCATGKLPICVPRVGILTTSSRLCFFIPRTTCGQCTIITGRSIQRLPFQPRKRTSESYSRRSRQRAASQGKVVSVPVSVCCICSEHLLSFSVGQTRTASRKPTTSFFTNSNSFVSFHPRSNEGFCQAIRRRKSRIAKSSTSSSALWC